MNASRWAAHLCLGLDGDNEERMTEQVFLAESNVQVTRSRIVIANQTYPMTGVTSVRTETVPPNRQ